MVKDGQVVRLRQLLRPSTTLKEIALQANMDTKTARKYIRLSALPSENHRIREWRTRTDPLAGVWEEVAGQLQRNPTTSATAVLSALQVADPESLSKTQLRTLQRRIKGWKKNNPSKFDVISDPQIARTWLLGLLQSDNPAARIEQEFADRGDLLPVAELVKCGGLRERKRALAIFAGLKGLRVSLIAECLQLSRKTVKRCGAAFASDGPAALIATKKRSVRGGGDAECGRFLFSLLHSPPSAHGINRSSWKMDDIHRILAENAHGISRQKIRAILKNAGFKWRKARRVLTSNDPDYHAKVAAIKKILSELKEDQAFFSIDEYGPFAVKRKGGIKRIAPGENHTVPQWQKSKGWMILTAALELSRNQVSHFYSRAKTTNEMIKMADLLRTQYHTCRTIYLSWDAASWHVSKRLYAHLDEVNRQASTDGFPIVITAPLPTGAQFLNVIESVFSGMAKAVIHNSDYQSVEAAQNAINRYFGDRNEQFSKHPKRAGNKIWGQERVPSEFSEAHNCKDPRYR
jgi:transposase